MKKLLCLIMIIISFSACSKSNAIYQDIQSLPSSPEKEDQIISNLVLSNMLESSYIAQVINIAAIENAERINVAWKDENSIYFVTQVSTSDSLIEEKNTLEIFKYHLTRKSLDKVFEYHSNEHQSYLYIQVLDSGDLALKHTKGFVIVSGKDYSIIAEIEMPEEIHYVNYNISYDGKKIAVAYRQEKRLDIIDAMSKKVLQSVEIPHTGNIQAPKWTTNSASLILYASAYEFVSEIFVYDLQSKELFPYDFSDNLYEYDNEAYLSSDAKTVYRMDSMGDNHDNLELLAHAFNLKTSKLETWGFHSPMPPYCKSISEKGYMIGHVYYDYHSLLIADLDAEKVVSTEEAHSGGAQYSPIWARDQEKAIVLFTLNENNYSNFKWGAAIIDAKKAVEG